MSTLTWGLIGREMDFVLMASVDIYESGVADWRLANICQGLVQCLHMGNLDVLRDWGHAKDYLRMQWVMLQQEQPEGFVIATGVQYSVRQFI